jgi:hypothetical protein
MAHLRRPPYTKPVPEGAEVFTRKGKRFARFRDRAGRLTIAPLTKDGRRVRLRSSKWYGEYRDADGVVRFVPLATDRTAAEQMLAELVRKAELARANIADPFEEHRRRALKEHLADFRRYLAAKGNTEEYAERTGNRVQALLDGCRFTFIADLSPSATVQWLADQRQAGAMGIQTSNYYLRDVKAFSRWLVKDRRTADNPLAHLSGMNPQGGSSPGAAQPFPCGVRPVHQRGTSRP